MSDTWDAAPLADNVVRPNAWDNAPLTQPAPTVQQRAAVQSADNGEEAARALKLGRKTGVNPSLIQTDLPGYDAHARAEDAKQATANPAIARYLEGNPIAASVSGDDYDALERSSQAVQALNQDRLNGSSALSTLSRIAQAAKEGAVKGIGESPGPTGVTNEFIEAMQKTGIFRQPGAAPVGLQFLNEATILPTAAAINTLMRGVGGAIVGAGSVLGQGAREAGADNRAGVFGVASPDRLEREFQNFAVFGMTASPFRAQAPAAPRMLTTEEFLGRVQAQVDREAIDAFINRAPENKPVLMLTKAEDASAGLDRAIEVAQESKTKTRDPNLFAESVAAHDPGELHIDAGKVAELYQREGKVPAEGDGLLGFVPGLADKIESAAATGGEVTVPVADYIAHVDPTVHQGLKDVVRLHNDGVTLTEAKEAEENFVQGYHGSTDVVTNFDPEQTRLGRGVFFAEDPALASKFAQGVATDSDPIFIYGEDTPKSITRFVREMSGNAEAQRISAMIEKAEAIPDKSNSEEYSKAANKINDELRKISSLSEEVGGGAPNVTRAKIDLGRTYKADMGGKFDWDKERDAIKHAIDNGYNSVTFDNTGAGKYYTVFNKNQIRTGSEGVLNAVEQAAVKEKGLMGLDTKVFMNMVFEDAAALNITEPEFKAYSDKVARAEQYILDRAVKVNRDKIAQALSAEWKRNEAAVRSEVETNVASSGVFAAEKFLRENKIQLGGDNIDLVADDLAPLFGFDSGDLLRRALTELETVQAADNKPVRRQREDFIKAETARLMEERHGRLAEKIAQEAREIALADHTFDVLADEVRILASASGVRPPLGREAMVDWARGRFEASGISDAANLEKLQRAVAKGGREAEKALLKGDYPEAFQAKQRQFLAAVVAKESLKLQKVIDSTEVKIDRYTSEQVVASMDQTHLEAIREMLASVGVPQIHAPVQPPVPLRDLVAESQGQLAVAPWLEEGRPPQIKDMTVEQFRAFADSLKSMEHVGRQAKKLFSAQGEAELQNVIVDVKTELERFKFVDQPAAPSIAQRAKSIGRYALGSHLLVERMFDYIDKFNPEGPLTKYIDRPLRDSNVKELQLTERASAMLRDLYPYVDASLVEQVPNTLIRDALDKTGFRKMTRQSLRQVMLNTGNFSNMQKLTEGYGINEADLRRWVDQHAKPADVAWVNGVWKIFEMLKPEADAMQLRDTGVPVDTIPAQAWDVKGGKLNGGYYPIVYDKYNSDIVGHRAAQNPIFDSHYVQATTPHKYTEARTEYKGALDLEGAFLSSRIQGMIHDIAFREAVRSANRLISNQEFRTALAQRWGKEYVELLPGWLKDIANSHNLDDAYAQGLARGMSLIRQNVVNTLIGYNPSTVLKHGFTALVMSANRVGALDLLGATKELGLKGSASTAADLVRRGEAIVPDEMFMQAFRDNLDRGERGEGLRQFVLQSSAVMRNRSRQVDDTIRGAIDKMDQFGVLGAFKNLREKNIQYGRFAVAFSDQLSAVPTWYAAYKQAYTGGASHADSVFIADKEVSRAHGSQFVGDQPAVTRLGNTPMAEFFKLFTSLFKFYNHFANNNFQFAWDSAEYLRGNKRQEPGANAARISAWTASVISVLMIEYAAGAALDKDKKGPLHTLMMGALHLFGGQFIILREITSGAAHGYGPASGLMGTIWKAGEETVKDIGKASGAKAGLAKNWIKHTADSIGFATGLATSQVGRTGQFVSRVAQGQERPRTFDQWRQGLRTGSMKPRVH